MAEQAHNTGQSYSTARHDFKLPILEQVKIAGSTPLSCTDGDHYLSQAYSLITVMQEAFNTADAIGSDVIEVNGIQHDNYLMTIRPSLIARSLEGIGTLMALAQHYTDVRAAHMVRRAN